MKYLFLALILTICTLIGMETVNGVSTPSASSVTTLSASAPTTRASVAGDVEIAFEQTDDDTGGTGNFFLRNWGVLAMGVLAFLDVVARLTPTTKDNSIVNLLATIVNAIIPNFKKGGGRF